MPLLGCLGPITAQTCGARGTQGSYYTGSQIGSQNQIEALFTKAEIGTPEDPPESPVEETNVPGGPQRVHWARGAPLTENFGAQFESQTTNHSLNNLYLEIFRRVKPLHLLYNRNESIILQLAPRSRDLLGSWCHNLLVPGYTI